MKDQTEDPHSYIQRIFLLFDLSSTVQNICFIYLFIYPLRVYYELTVGLIAQLVEHYTGIAEVMGSIPFKPEFFSGFLFATA